MDVRHLRESLPLNSHIIRHLDVYISLEDEAGGALYYIMPAHQGDLSRLYESHRKEGRHVLEEMVWSTLHQLATALALCHSPVDQAGNPKGRILHRNLDFRQVLIRNNDTIALRGFRRAPWITSVSQQAAEMFSSYLNALLQQAPESSAGLPYTAETDVWALGALLYRLCSWSHPVVSPAPNRQRSLFGMLPNERERPLPATTIAPLPSVYSSRLGELLKLMLSSDPNARPTAADLQSIRPHLACPRATLPEWPGTHEDLQLMAKALSGLDRKLGERKDALDERERALLFKEQEQRDGIRFGCSSRGCDPSSSALVLLLIVLKQAYLIRFAWVYVWLLRPTSQTSTSSPQSLALILLSVFPASVAFV